MIKKIIMLLVLSLLIFSASVNMSIANTLNHGGYALSFDGVDDYVSIVDSDLWNFNGDFAIEAWINIPSSKPFNYPRFIVAHSDDNINRSFALYSNVGGAQPELQLSSQGNEWDNLSYYLNAPMEVSQWHHIAVVRAAGKVATYFDGEQIMNVFQSSSITGDGVPNTSGFNLAEYSLFNSSEPLNIGSGNMDYFFVGLIDDVRIWNKALTQEEIQANMTMEIGPQVGLVGYWKFDEGSGDIAHDSSGNGNDGTLINGPAWTYQMGTEPDINVDPINYDFGKVEVGPPSTMYVNIANTGGSTLTVDDIYFQYAISGEPFVAEIPALPLEIAANTSIDIPVSYSPSFLFAAQSNDLVIVSDDADEPTVEVALTGTGVIAAGNPPDAIENIQLYISLAEANDSLVFINTGSEQSDSGEAHYDAFMGMLSSAGSANNGCGQLQAAYKRVDGDTKQKDWVEGPAATSVATAIQNVMNEMGCD